MPIYVHLSVTVCLLLFSRYFQAGGSPENVIQLLSENYTAVAQTVNLLAEWLIQTGARGGRALALPHPDLYGRPYSRPLGRYHADKLERPSLFSWFFLFVCLFSWFLRPLSVKTELLTHFHWLDFYL